MSVPSVPQQRASKYSNSTRLPPSWRSCLTPRALAPLLLLISLGLSLGFVHCYGEYFLHIHTSNKTKQIQLV